MARLDNAKLEANLGALAETMILGPLLAMVTERWGGYELLAHWTQGEFHHDVVLKVSDQDQNDLSGMVLVVSTNCNGGVKEVLCFEKTPARWALWHKRCPEVPEFSGTLTPILGVARTAHWFDPCALLAENARSELKPEYRKRQRGGGWVLNMPSSGEMCTSSESQSCDNTEE